MTIFVLLPAYNEEDSLPALIPKIFRALTLLPHPFRVVLVDDGSTDRTAARAQELRGTYPLEILTHPLNRGLGETIRDGIEYCVREGGPGDIVVRLDCDDSQDPAYIPALVAEIQDGRDVVLTSRYQPGGGQSGVHGYRNVLSRGAGLFMKLMFPIRGVWDYSSGYRAYRWEILRDALAVFGNRFIEQMHLGFSCTLEKVVKLHLLGARFAEVPHVLRYDQKKSASKMASRPTLIGYLLLAWRYSPWLGFRRRAWQRRIAAQRTGLAPTCATAVSAVQDGVPWRGGGFSPAKPARDSRPPPGQGRGLSLAFKPQSEIANPQSEIRNPQLVECLCPDGT